MGGSAAAACPRIGGPRFGAVARRRLLCLRSFVFGGYTRAKADAGGSVCRPRRWRVFFTLDFAALVVAGRVGPGSAILSGAGGRHLCHLPAARDSLRVVWQRHQCAGGGAVAKTLLVEGTGLLAAAAPGRSAVFSRRGSARIATRPGDVRFRGMARWHFAGIVSIAIGDSMAAVFVLESDRVRDYRSAAAVRGPACFRPPFGLWACFGRPAVAGRGGLALEA